MTQTFILSPLQFRPTQRRNSAEALAGKVPGEPSQLCIPIEAVYETTTPYMDRGRGDGDDRLGGIMNCPHCSATCSKIGQFVIPKGTAKTVVALFQCRGCKTIQLEVEERDN